MRLIIILRSARIQVPATTLTAICQKYAPKEIHFLKIDVEGFEKNVLDGMDFRKFRPWILCIEATEPLRIDLPTYQEWEHIPLAAGYDFVQSDNLNRWYLANKHSERRRAFEFRVDDYLHYNYKRRLEELERRVSELNRSRSATARAYPAAEFYCQASRDKRLGEQEGSGLEPWSINLDFSTADGCLIWGPYVSLETGD